MDKSHRLLKLYETALGHVEDVLPVDDVMSNWTGSRTTSFPHKVLLYLQYLINHMHGTQAKP